MTWIQASLWKCCSFGSSFRVVRYIGVIVEDVQRECLWHLSSALIFQAHEDSVSGGSCLSRLANQNALGFPPKLHYSVAAQNHPLRNKFFFNFLGPSPTPSLKRSHFLKHTNREIPPISQLAIATHASGKVPGQPSLKERGNTPP